MKRNRESFAKLRVSKAWVEAERRNSMKAKLYEERLKAESERKTEIERLQEEERQGFALAQTVLKKTVPSQGYGQWFPDGFKPKASPISSGVRGARTARSASAPMPRPPPTQHRAAGGDGASSRRLLIPEEAAARAAETAAEALASEAAQTGADGTEGTLEGSQTNGTAGSSVGTGSSVKATSLPGEAEATTPSTADALNPTYESDPASASMEQGGQATQGDHLMRRKSRNQSVAARMMEGQGQPQPVFGVTSPADGFSSPMPMRAGSLPQPPTSSSAPAATSATVPCTSAADAAQVARPRRSSFTSLRSASTPAVRAGARGGPLAEVAVHQIL